MLTPHRDAVWQIQLGVSSPMTMQAASVGSAINTSYPLPKPFALTITNNIGSRTAVAVGVTVGVLLALLAAALIALLLYVKRKIRGFADGRSKKDLRFLIEIIVRNQASREGQAEEAMIEHTMTSAVNDIHEVEEHTDDLHSHGQIVEADIGGRDDRAELM